MRRHSRSHPSRSAIADARGLVGLLGSTLLLLACPSDPPEVSDSTASTSGASSTGDDPIPTSTGPTASGSGIVDDTSASASAGTGGDPMECCAAHPEAGCADPDLARCVCTQEASCCAFAWDDTCVDLAEQCGGCATETTTGDATDTTGGPSTMCCEPSGQPGCPRDPALETCVCALDPYCCDTEWDDQCVDEAQSDCGLECMVVGGDGDCCMANDSSGCDDPAVEGCVCALDPYCCDTDWDGICVSEAQYACMDDCGLPPPDMGDCCTAQPGPGCGDMVVSACTCMIDPDCCLFPWSDECTLLAVTSCELVCEGVDPLPPCCLPTMAPGCGDMVVEDCVCAFDAFCCDTDWDGQCVDEAQMSCMLDCMP